MNIQLIDDPFPHVIIADFFTKEEVELIHQELAFLSMPGQLLESGVHHSNPDLTTSKAIHLEKAYTLYEISNILQINKKSLAPHLVKVITNKWPHFKRLSFANSIITKVRYYHNGEGYVPHTDIYHDFLTFTYFHTEPKKFTGGDIYFPEYDYEISCDNNKFILIGGYVQHGVREVKIDNDEYWNGNGRYCISQFMNGYRDESAR